LVEQKQANELQKQLAISDDKRKWAETAAKKEDMDERAEDRAMDNVRKDDELAWQKKVDIAEIVLDSKRVKNDKAKQADRAEGSEPASFRFGT
jgi:hypothetical protein